MDMACDTVIPEESVVANILFKGLRSTESSKLDSDIVLESLGLSENAQKVEIEKAVVIL